MDVIQELPNPVRLIYRNIIILWHVKYVFGICYVLLERESDFIPKKWAFYVVPFS